LILKLCFDQIQACLLLDLLLRIQFWLFSSTMVLNNFLFFLISISHGLITMYLLLNINLW
jgi:hypothetical protein